MTSISTCIVKVVVLYTQDFQLRDSECWYESYEALKYRIAPEIFIFILFRCSCFFSNMYACLILGTGIVFPKRDQDLHTCKGSARLSRKASYKTEVQARFLPSTFFCSKLTLSNTKNFSFRKDGANPRKVKYRYRALLLRLASRPLIPPLLLAGNLTVGPSIHATSEILSVNYRPL